jgi:hypothetical protein
LIEPFAQFKKSLPPPQQPPQRLAPAPAASQQLDQRSPQIQKQQHVLDSSQFVKPDASNIQIIVSCLKISKSIKSSWSEKIVLLKKIAKKLSKRLKLTRFALEALYLLKCLKFSFFNQSSIYFYRNRMDKTPVITRLMIIIGNLCNCKN